MLSCPVVSNPYQTPCSLVEASHIGAAMAVSPIFPILAVHSSTLNPFPTKSLLSNTYLLWWSTAMVTSPLTPSLSILPLYILQKVVLIIFLKSLEFDFMNGSVQPNVLFSVYNFFPSPWQAHSSLSLAESWVVQFLWARHLPHLGMQVACWRIVTHQTGTTVQHI